MNVAIPPFTTAVPSVDEPSMKVTVPVGTPTPEMAGATDAVNVTDWPYTVVLAVVDNEVEDPTLT